MRFYHAEGGSGSHHWRQAVLQDALCPYSPPVCPVFMLSFFFSEQYILRHMFFYLQIHLRFCVGIQCEIHICTIRGVIYFHTVVKYL